MCCNFQQECQTLNKLVLKVSSAIQELDTALLSGYHAIIQALQDIALSLSNDRVPYEWLNCFCGSKLQPLFQWLSSKYPLIFACNFAPSCYLNSFRSFLLS